VSWRALVLSGVGEPEVLPALQQVLNSERHATALFTTVCTMALFQTDRQVRVRLRVAGHPPPIMLRPDLAELPHQVGPPLGVLVDPEWPAVTTALPPGWALLLYTDGLIEGWSGPDQLDRLWNNGLLALLEEHRDTDLSALPGQLVEQAVDLNGGPLRDDVAILLLSDGGPDR
jgi:serine phosphatase RsbU (regulator of sigma subunit)